MRNMTRLASGWILLGSAILALILMSAFPSRLAAQTTSPPVDGDNSAYVGSGSSNTTGGSLAVVDLTPYDTGDICAAIAYIEQNKYTPSNSNGLVIDARGAAPPIPGTAIPCASDPFAPVSQGTIGYTILLPAATIAIGTTWHMPSDVRIIGQGQGQTIIQALPNFSGDMIDMGSSVLVNGVSIEHLTLDAQGQGVHGIVNVFANELSYVNDVSLINFGAGGIGLYLETHTGNAGPYSNISFSGTGTCVQISGVSNNRGIHGLTCTSPGTSNAAVVLDASNNSIEDVYISGFADGILVGANAPAQNNILFNISGGSGVSNLIHISNATGAGDCPPQNRNADPLTVDNACDLTVLGASKSGNTTTIKDDLQGGATLTDGNVAMYVLGERIAFVVNGVTTTLGYSRFSTSPNFPSWLVGSSSAQGTSCSNGSLYSNTSGTSGQTLSACVNSSWKFIR